MNRLLSLVVCFLGLLPASALAATTAAASAAAGQALAQRLESYRTFAADFTQVVVSKSGGQVQKTTGNLKAKRPGLFYWHAKPPLEQYIVADGKQVKVYDPDLMQVTIQKMDQRLSSTPALLLSGNVKGLDDAYRISEQKQAAGSVRFTLVPRNPDSLFESLELDFRGGRLQAMRLKDSLDQRSTLSFTHVRINQSIPDSAFELDLPKGVDVIRGQQ